MAGIRDTREFQVLSAKARNDVKVLMYAVRELEVVGDIPLDLDGFELYNEY